MVNRGDGETEHSCFVSPVPRLSHIPLQEDTEPPHKRKLLDTQRANTRFTLKPNRKSPSKKLSALRAMTCCAVSHCEVVKKS